MRHRLVIWVAAVAIAAGAIICPAVSTAQTPPMAGGYKDVIAVPVDDPNVKAIAAALFEPEGEGPFPAVIYMSGSSGIDGPPDRGLQKALIGHLRSEGFATLIVDPFTPRNEPFGISEKLDGPEALQYFDRGARDALAAVRLLRTKHEIDPQRVFLQGYSYGATSAIRAVDGEKASKGAERIAGVIAFYPLCDAKLDPSVPVLVLIGLQDEVTPAARCEGVKGKPNIEVVVYPGVTHAFALPGLIEGDFFGHHMAYDSRAARDAQQRADAFIAAHMGLSPRS